MIPYDKLTIIRNRHRARELRRFRDAVETYFERAEYVAPDMSVDWDGVRAVRAEVNQMLPRVLQVVHAAGLDARDVDSTDPGPSAADVRVLRNIFAARYAEGGDQAVLDVIDMAIGVYEASRFDAMLRTVNPFHYVGRMLVFLAKVPRRTLAAIGLWPQQRAPRLRPEELARLEAVASRFADADEVIERRFAEIRDRLAQRYGDSAAQVVELGERLDFLERVLAQQRPAGQLEAPQEPT